MSYTDMDPDRPLAKFALELPAILAEAEYNEMYGVQLHAATDNTSVPHTTYLILQKFLRANANNLPLARSQLLEALQWRKTYNPLAALHEIFPAQKFGGLGYIATLHNTKQPAAQEPTIATFNIYGAAGSKDPKLVFGDTDAFVRWRVALMELTLAQLDLPNATELIPDYATGSDPYQAVQIHDYQNISFFRPPAEVKASSTKIISLFQKYYPETVSFKYFVNVPLIMSWMMALMKGLVSRDSVQKMTWMTTGAELKNYLGDEVPVEYGGTGKALSEAGLTVNYDDTGATAATATTATTAATSLKGNEDVDATANATSSAEKPATAAPPVTST